MKNIITIWSHRLEAVASFGQATLHRRGDGRYELHGGSPADRAKALEWASLFQHDAVFPVRREWAFKSRIASGAVVPTAAESCKRPACRS